MKCPGFVDLQVNGHLGIDYSSGDLTEESFIHTCLELRKDGTSAFLPTVITSEEKIYERNLPLMVKALRHPEVRRSVLGFHLEGPFMSPEPGARGAHNPNWMRAADTGFLDRLQELASGEVRLMTIAAEIPGAEALIRHSVKKKIAMSLGHQLAGEKEINAAALAGAVALTHLGNGVPQTIDRHQNPLWAGLASEALTAMLITDGHHIPPAFIRSVILAKGVQKTIIVSDASPVAGLPPGTYQTLGNNVVLEPSGYLRSLDTGYMAGSSSTMRQCVNYMASLRFVETKDLFRMAITNPLKLIGATENDLSPCEGFCWDEKTASFGFEKI